MNIGANPGAVAAQQLMQATTNAVHMSMRQIDAVNNNLSNTKAKALENTAKQEVAATERKRNQIDIMA